MAAPKGHKYTVGNNGGRPELYTDEDSLIKVINSYFNDDAYIEIGESFIFAPTMSGLARRLGMSRETLCQYGKKEKFSDAIKQARQIVEESLEQKLYGTAVTGVIFNLKNNFAWTDKQDLNHQSSDGSMTPTKVVREIVDATKD